jgi:hypothetical protein
VTDLKNWCSRVKENGMSVRCDGSACSALVLVDAEGKLQNRSRDFRLVSMISESGPN